MPVKNTCQCESPPGGVTECEPNQTAYCIVKDGVARHVCITPRGEDPVHQLRSIYSYVTDEVMADGPFTRSLIEFFLEGRYEDYVENKVVTFNLTSKLKDFLSGLDIGSSNSSETPVEPDQPMLM